MCFKLGMLLALISTLAHAIPKGGDVLALSKIADGEECPTGDDDTCINGECGHYSENGPYRCCPDGMTYTPQFARLIPEYTTLWCSNLPDGAGCQHDEQCQSSVCMNLHCASSNIPFGAPCPIDIGQSDADMLCTPPDGEPHGYCGRYDTESGYYCCKIYASMKWSDTWCGDLPLGHKCHHDDQCQSDECSSSWFLNDNGHCTSS